MKRLLPLGVLLLAAGAHAGVIVPINEGGGGGAAKGRCPGIAELEKQLASAAMKLPKEPWKADAKFDGKEHCGQEIWNYLAKSAKESTSFNTLDGKYQIQIIKDYAKSFEDLDALVAKIEPLVESYRKEVLTFRDQATKAKKKLELLPRILSKEGENATLQPTQHENVLEGGSSFAAIRQAISAVAGHPLMVRHGAASADPFTAAYLRRLWTPMGIPPLNSKVNTGAYSFVDWKQGQQVWDHYKAALDIVNGVNAEVRGKDKKGTIRELRVTLMYEDLNAPKDGEVKKDPKDAKPSVTTQGDQVTGDLAIFKDAFEKKASAEIFDGLKRGIDNRKNLPPDDPKHLTEAQAKKAYDEIHGQYKDAKAEVNGDKIAMVITDKEGKKVKLSETLVPKELTVAKADELGSKVGRQILAGDEFGATYTAVMAAILGDEVPKTHVKDPDGTKTNLGNTGGSGGGEEPGGPSGFAKDVANADCGGVTDIGKNDQTLALKARNKDIAKLSADHSKARADVTKAHAKTVADAKSAYEAKVAAIDAAAAKERENPFFTDFEGQAARVKASKDEAKKVYDAAVATADADQKAAFKEDGRVGTEDQLKTKTSLLEKQKNEDVRAYYKENVAARVDSLWGTYKKRDAGKITDLSIRLGSVNDPLDTKYLTSDLFDKFFKEKYGEKEVREANLKQLTKDIGVPETGNITGSLPAIGEVDVKIENQLTAYFKKIMKDKADKEKAWKESQKKQP